MDRSSRRKNPVLAAVLALTLGPLGHVYLGWRLAIISTLQLALFAALVVALNLPVRPWMFGLLAAAYAFMGWALAAWWWNRALEQNEGMLEYRGSFAGTFLLLKGQLPLLGHFYAIALGIHLATRLFAAGRIVKGLFALFVGTGVFILFSLMLFRFFSELITWLALRHPRLPAPEADSSP